MPKMTVCVFGDKEIDIEMALDVRDQSRRLRGKLDLKCVECNKPVRAHKESSNGMAAHFEHFERNPDCSLSYDRRL